ncbi:hypothetical protein CVT25_007718 [Psilocybe cyanescens]|uniref:Uncharacterized protein n=1 Tax=Psilocybe cyanescens TaxID=93625 RepID=A0A409XPD5_PSICY|nr:hypothetical protein CVT25_007718 [Psilocybe cyanescens]
MPDEKKNVVLFKFANIRDQVRDQIGSPRSGSPLPGNAQATTQSARGSTAGTSTPILTTSAPPSGHSIVTQLTAPLISAAPTSSATPLASAAAPASVAHSIAATVPAPVPAVSAVPPVSGASPAPAAPPASAPVAVPAPAVPPALTAVPAPAAPPSASAAGAGSSGSAPSLFHQAKENVPTALKGANVFLKVLKEVSVVSPPLRLAVVGLIMCIEKYQNSSGNHDEMMQGLEKIREAVSVLTTRLNELKGRKRLNGMVERLTRVIANTSPNRSLNEEIKKIEFTQKPELFSRMATSCKDVERRVSSYRTISKVLNQFQIDLGVQVGRISSRM